jgi:hypothetical protein
MNFIQLKRLPSLLITPDFVATSQVKTVLVDPFPEALMRNCTHNVKRFIEENGGSAEYGWAVSALGNVLIRFVGHCVVRRDSGELVCVTPPECTYIDEMAFIPDPSIAVTDQNRERLPTITFPLINNSVAIQYADLENVSSTLRSKYPSKSSLDDNRSSTTLTEKDSKVMTDVTIRIRRLMPDLQALVVRTYGSNQYCLCNSGKKYKKCCQDKMKARLRKRA